MRRATVVALVVGWALTGLVGYAEREKDIPISQVPQKVLDAARQAVPGIELTEAEVEQTDKGLVYEVEGKADGKAYELTITAEGEVLAVRQEDPDDD